MAKLLELRPDSEQSGLCDLCIHLVDGKCNTNKPCGQVMACRSQVRAMVVGRFPSGRVRKTPLKRVRKEKVVRILAWQETYKKMSEFGDMFDCVWIGFLSKSLQVRVRRLIKRGDIEVTYIVGATSRKMPATFISKMELYNHFSYLDDDCKRTICS